MIYRFAGIAIDEDRDEIRREGEVVPAQKKVRDLLLYLIHRRDRLVPKEELFAALWPGVTVNESALTQALYGARRVVDDDARSPRVLETVRGRGVRFVAPVEIAAPAAASEAAAGEPGDGGEDAASSAPFVGREGLLEELGGALRAATAGEGGVFLMAGEPGIGKTRAAEEFAALARARGADVHLGRCHEAPGAPAFWPWVQLLRSQAEACSADRFASLLGTGAEDVAQIAPDLVAGDRARREAVRREALVDPGPARFRVFDAVTRLFQRAAAERPVVLVIDDLHRADPPSWRLLSFLAREIRGDRLLVLGTYRDADAHRDAESAELLAELARQSGVRSVALEGLGREGVAALVRAALGREPEWASIEALHERTKGNPYFVTQLASRLAAASREGEEEGIDPSRLALPSTLRGAVAGQVEALSEHGREVLRAASVVGRCFALNVLGPVTGLSDADLLDALDAGARVGLVTRDGERIGRFAFSHILVRDALYESLPAERRARLHARVGEALERAHAPDPEPCLDELAHHFVAAAALDDAERGIHYARQAGALARSRLAFEDAARHYASALELYDLREDGDADLRCQLLLELGEAQTRAGRRDEARANFSKAASLATVRGASETLARVALASAPGFFSIESGVYDAFTVSLLEGALATLPAGSDGLRAQTLSRLAMALYWSPAAGRRGPLVREAAEAAARTEDPTASAYALAARYAALWTPETLEDRLRIGPELRSRADASGDLGLVFMARVFEITTLLEQGRGAEFAAAVRDFERLARERDDLHARWFAGLFQANYALMRGDLEESLRHAHAFREIGIRLDDRNALQSFVAHQVTSRFAQGELEGLAEGAEEQAASYPSMVVWKCAEILFRAARGDAERARELLARWVDPELRAIPTGMNYVIELGFLGFAAAASGARDAAAVLYEALEPYSDRFLVGGYASVCWGSAARPLSALARVLGNRRAEEHAAHAVEAERRAGVSIWWAEALAELGRRRAWQHDAADFRRAVERQRPRVRERA